MEALPDAVSAPESVDDDTLTAARLLAVGLNRALGRRPRWNESLHPAMGSFVVALGDQTGISADPPYTGAEETA